MRIGGSVNNISAVLAYIMADECQHGQNILCISSIDCYNHIIIFLTYFP